MNDQDDFERHIEQIARKYRAVLDALAHEPDPEKLPSASDATWVVVRAPGSPPPTRPGKWCVFRTHDEVDDTWRVIQAAVITGRLLAAKASGAARAAKFGGVYLIAVYTGDCTDLEDVRRARAVLRELGVREAIGYKCDGSRPDEWLMTE
jgi:hypothetical protein